MILGRDATDDEVLVSVDGKVAVVTGASLGLGTFTYIC